MKPSSELTISNDGTTINGPAINCEQVFQCSVVVVSTSTIAGDAKVQCSNDPYIPGHLPANWSDIASATVAVSTAGAVNIPKLDICYNYIRVVWTKSGGSGTLKAYVRTNAI